MWEKKHKCKNFVEKQVECFVLVMIFIIYALLFLVANCPLMDKIWNVKLKRLSLSAHSDVGYVLLFYLNNIKIAHGFVKDLVNANYSSSIKEYSIWQFFFLTF